MIVGDLGGAEIAQFGSRVGSFAGAVAEAGHDIEILSNVNEQTMIQILNDSSVDVVVVIGHGLGPTGPAQGPLLYSDVDGIGLPAIEQSGTSTNPKDIGHLITTSIGTVPARYITANELRGKITNTPIISAATCRLGLSNEFANSANAEKFIGTRIDAQVGVFEIQVRQWVSDFLNGNANADANFLTNKPSNVIY